MRPTTYVRLEADVYKTSWQYSYGKPPPPPSLTELGLRIVDDVSDSQRFLWILYGARYRYTRLLVDHYDMIS